MLTLSLLRHAKSSWDDVGSSDFERPLAPRGLEAAPRMGRAMRTAGIKPTLILCSAATRTRQTLDLVLPELGTPVPNVIYDEKLYLAPPVQMLDCIQRLPASEPHVLMVGHNPGHQILAFELAGSGDKAALAAVADKFPTAARDVLSNKTREWRDDATRRGPHPHSL